MGWFGLQARAATVAVVWFGSAWSVWAQAGDFQGTWIIAKARIAPWADPLQRGGAAEERRLLGRTVVIGLGSVTGPSPLGCLHAIYRVHDDTADLLFEGGLTEPDQNGRPRDAGVLAQALGMTTHSVRTLETSCSEVAYHRFSRTTLVFGLNNRIYTLYRAR